MRDRTLGGLLFSLSIIAMVLYFWWLFLSPKDWLLLGRPLSDWALIVPVLILVYAFLFIVAWIGKTMATTPSSISIPKGESGED